MRVHGKRRVRSITAKASGESLREGAIFNDELHKLPTGQSTFIPRGIYRFKTHEDAARHRDECELKRMLSRERQRI